MFTELDEITLAEKGLLETAELLKFSADFALGIKQAMADDGKVGALEGVKLAFTLAGEAHSAFAGVTKIPAELNKLDAGDVEILGDIIWPAFKGLPSHQRDLLNASLGAVRELVNLYRVVVDPPKATVLPE